MIIFILLMVALAWCLAGYCEYKDLLKYATPAERLAIYEDPAPFFWRCIYLGPMPLIVDIITLVVKKVKKWIG